MKVCNSNHFKELKIYKLRNIDIPAYYLGNFKKKAK